MAESVPEYKPKAGSDRPPNRSKEAKESKRKGLDPNRPFKHTLPQLRKTLEDEIGLVILGFSTAGDLHCAEVLADGSEKMIDSWIWLAEKHVGFRRTLEYICGGGGYVAVITSTLGVVLPIAQHHGAYPAHWPTPSSLFGLFAFASANENGNGHNGEASESESIQS